MWLNGLSSVKVKCWQQRPCLRCRALGALVQRFPLTLCSATRDCPACFWPQRSNPESTNHTLKQQRQFVENKPNPSVATSSGGPRTSGRVHCRSPFQCQRAIQQLSPAITLTPGISTTLTGQLYLGIISLRQRVRPDACSRHLSTRQTLPLSHWPPLAQVRGFLTRAHLISVIYCIRIMLWNHHFINS